ESTTKAVRDAQLMQKAEILSSAGESSRAYETLCRISSFGMNEANRADLLRRKLITSYEAGLMDDFSALLSEASGTGLMDIKLPEGKPRHKSEDAAMLLSIIPGAGLAYAGDYANAGKYFLINSSIIALGVGTFLSELYVTTFLGGGMLLYKHLPESTNIAVRATADRNISYLKEFYAPVYETLKQSRKNQETPAP
ncbi:MAG: hypothetical protein IKZ60_08045, partial [Bacteroidales bacterium]|nr:hypothetical protein [Bacteroidales bacterium]